MLKRLDDFLLEPPLRPFKGIKRFIVEFLFFGVKEARSCLFAGFSFLFYLRHPVKEYWVYLVMMFYLFLLLLSNCGWYGENLKHGMN